MFAWLTEIIHNLALLLSLGLLFHLLRQWLPLTRRLGKVFFGVLCGGLGIFCMFTAVVSPPGVMFDGRTIVMTLAGLFAGGTGGVIAMAMTGSYRWFMAGPGLLAGLATILAAGTAGILARRLISSTHWPPTPLQLWATGMVAHLLALACLTLLPEPILMDALSRMAVPFLVIYPLVVVVLGTIMATEENRSFSLAQLKHAEWLFSEAQKVTRFGSWEYRVDTDQLTATPYFYQLLGLPGDAAPFTLQDLFGRLHRDDWDAVRLAFDAALRDACEIDAEGRLVADDGREFWIRLVGKPIFGNGKALQLVGNLVDITRRKTSELRLRASEERLQAVIDHAPALICLCDLEGNVTLANRRIELFGNPGGSVVGRPFYELLPRGGALEQWIDDMVALRAGERIEFEETLRHVDGTVHTYLASKFLLASSGSRADTIGYVAADISELRGALAGLQRLTAELTAKNDELERFGTIVSHDLKAPLLTIGSYATLLREDLDAGSSELVLTDLGHIRMAVDKMRQLIDDLLQHSRIGRATGELVDVDLNEVTADMLQLLAGEIRQAGAEIAVAADLPTVRGDALRLRQVLQNLVQNALKYRAPDRPLVVNIGWSTDPAGNVLLDVRDNGCGIADADQERIFGLFERASEGGEGLGVGLALARRIMEKHGGGIRVESAVPDTGSRFILHFPARSAAAKPCAREVPAMPPPACRQL